MNNTVLNRKTKTGDGLSSAPGGPKTEVFAQSPKSQPPPSMSNPGPRETPSSKSQSSAILIPEQMINKSPSELPQGVDPNKREVGNEE